MAKVTDSSQPLILNPIAPNSPERAKACVLAKRGLWAVAGLYPAKCQKRSFSKSTDRLPINNTLGFSTITHPMTICETTKLIG